ncbi:purine catabolism regulator [Kibdelosporangium banguiense]|uniref:Purine catabolism regulator n=1 Tax=Kibdelosporangium banguiense TaxID=1365924 RepID=A0ABS4T763_9PSEU|nr:PucR family transcriptional regulator [Kibdelosporangium banguiense]MBP2320121.1 purine catabolism regulator [Kibdelosporangium banguiense]
MTLTLAALVRQRVFGLRVLAGDTALNRSVGWVHVSELADPTPFLRPETLLLTTGLQLGPPSDYVARLVSAGAVGVGFGVGLSHASAPAPLIAACEDAGLPLLEVPLATRFADINRFVADDMARTAVRAARSTSDVEHALIRSLAAPDVAGEIVQRLSRWLHGWAMVLDQDIRAVAAAPARARRELRAVRAELERVTPAGRFSMSWSAGGAQVSVHPIEHRGGYLVVGTPGLGADGHGVISVALSLLAFQAEQATTVWRAKRALRDATARLLINGLPDDAAHTGIDLPRTPVCAAVIRGVDVRGVEAELPQALCIEDGDDLLCVLEEADVDALAHFLDQRGRAAVGDPVTLEKLPAGVAQARRLADALTAPGPVVVTSAEVRGTGLLAHVDTPAVRAYASALLAPLKGSTLDLIGTLRVFLACDGNWSDASATLEIHRHTLRYRIRKIEELLGRRIEDTGARAELWLALQLDN